MKRVVHITGDNDEWSISRMFLWHRVHVAPYRRHHDIHYERWLGHTLYSSVVKLLKETYKNKQFIVVYHNQLCVIIPELRLKFDRDIIVEIFKHVSNRFELIVRYRRSSWRYWYTIILWLNFTSKFYRRVIPSLCLTIAGLIQYHCDFVNQFDNVISSKC